MANRVKTSVEAWLGAARDALVSEGHAGVKIDRLAASLGVSRGGFYHHFKGHADLMRRLIRDWETSNNFLPHIEQVRTPSDAYEKFEELLADLIEEKRFSSAYELAVREWARVNPAIKRIVDKVDRKRIEGLAFLFSTLGCDEDEASIRARVLYYHQIGYYSLGHHNQQSKAERRRNAPTYLRILGGPRHAVAGRASGARRR